MPPVGAAVAVPLGASVPAAVEVVAGDEALEFVAGSLVTGVVDDAVDDGPDAAVVVVAASGVVAEVA